jgi:hypothetical protein
MTPNGRIVIFEEVVSVDMGITQFAQEMLRPILVNRYNMLGGTKIINFADPAGANKEQVDDVTCIQRMNQNGIYTVPCPLPTNSFVTRRECVADLLRLRIDDKPGLVIGPRCPVLHKGFNGGYCYRKMKITGSEDRYTEEADKNEYSHIHDALQYACYGAFHSGEDLRTPTSGFGNFGATESSGGGVDLGGFGV